MLFRNVLNYSPYNEKNKRGIVFCAEEAFNFVREKQSTHTQSTYGIALLESTSTKCFLWVKALADNVKYIKIRGCKIEE